MATGKWAKGSSEPIGIGVVGAEFDEEDLVEGDIVATGHSTNNIGDSSATRASKRAKTSTGDDESLIATLGRVGSELANAIVIAGEKLAPPPPAPIDEIPEHLYETL